jgi:hypothetical protein
MGQSLSALDEIGPKAKEAVAPLKDLIRTEKVPWIREGAVEALKKIEQGTGKESKRKE